MQANNSKENAALLSKKFSVTCYPMHLQKRVSTNFNEISLNRKPREKS
jgi:hypothetical protein